jgi:hypothetical protein
MVVGALRGEPIEPGDATMTERERLLGDVLNHVWFALMVGWSGGQQSQATILEQMSASIGLVLDEPERPA